VQHEAQEVRDADDADDDPDPDRRERAQLREDAADVRVARRVDERP
jgi:hypothetical protein